MQQPDTAPTRRAIVASAGLLATVAATGLPAMAGAAETAPSPIEAAYAEYVRLALIHDAAAEAALDLLDQYEEPVRPGYDHFRSEGGYDIAFTDETRKYGRSLIKVDDRNVEDLEAIIAAPFDPSRSEPSSVKWDRLSHERRIEQAKVTLQTVETWRAERGRRREALGLPAAEKLEAEAYDAAQAQIDVLLGMTPTNLREIAMQALVGRRQGGATIGLGDHRAAYRARRRQTLLRPATGRGLTALKTEG